jgi:hypothetical protein
MFKSIHKGISVLRVTVVCVCGVLVLAAMRWTNVPAVGASTPCSGRVVHDYGKLIRKLQLRHRSFPESNGLPGVSGVGLFPLDRDRVLLAGEHIGYRLEVLRHHKRTKIKPELRLQAQLFRLGRQGQHLIARQSRHETLQTGRMIEFGRKVPTGIYRLDVQVSTGKEVDLGSYKEFFQALPRRVDLRLATNGALFREGDDVIGRLENQGTVDALLPNGSALVVEHQVDSGWQEVPTGRADAIQVADPEFLYRGRATGCSSFKVPPESPPGAYRFAVVADPFGARLKSRTIWQQFQVVP